MFLKFQAKMPDFSQRNIDGRKVATIWGIVGLGRETNGIEMARADSPFLKEKLSDASTCPKELLLWFHHLPRATQVDGVSLNKWLRNNQMEGKTILNQNIADWKILENKIDTEFYTHPLLKMQDQYNKYIPLWEAEYNEGSFISK